MLDSSRCQEITNPVSPVSARLSCGGVYFLIRKKSNPQEAVRARHTDQQITNSRINNPIEKPQSRPSTRNNCSQNTQPSL